MDARRWRPLWLSARGYVRTVLWLTLPYLVTIEPFRRFMLCPAMLRRIRRAWIAAFGAAI